jgi:hypothetical protein
MPLSRLRTWSTMNGFEKTPPRYFLRPKDDENIPGPREVTSRNRVRAKWRVHRNTMQPIRRALSISVFYTSYLMSYNIQAI